MFSRRIEAVNTSVLKQVLELVKGGNVISFAGGVPSPELFPMDKLKELLNEAADDPFAFQYGSAIGMPELRSEIAHYMKRWDVKTSFKEIMITHGSQQGIDIIGRALINPGDVLIVEAPTYFVALNTFQVYEPVFEQVSLDEEGVVIEEFEELVKNIENEGKRIKLFYTISTFQNPTGITMSEERRKAVAELAEEHDFLIVEDGPYSELRYRGKDIRPIKTFAPERTIYLGTFSKIFVPGFRIAWLIAPESLIDYFEVAKQTADVCTNSFGQHVAWLFMKKGYLREQVEKLRRAYGPKMETMLDAIAEFMPEGVKWSEPDGGMFIWLTTGKDTDALLGDAVSRGVAYVPGSAFYAKAPAKNQMRLNFTLESADRIQEGIRILASLLS